MKRVIAAMLGVCLLGLGSAQAGSRSDPRSGNRPMSREAPRPVPPLGTRAGADQDHGFKSFPVKNERTFVPNELVIRYKPGVGPAKRADVRAQLGAAHHESLKVPGNVAVLKLDPGVRVRDAVATLQAHPLVEYAEPNYLYSLSSIIPSDTRFAELWGLNNSGQTIKGTSGVADADIDAPEAWDISTGSSAVKVAVVDTGVASGHPDLAPNMIPGWDFVENDATPQDHDGHGTHVAGTIGARGNDSYGVAGLNWRVSIIPIRVFGGDEFGTLGRIVNGMQYAVNQGADIVNLSLGGPGYSQSMADVISGAPDVLFVAAAGNGDPDHVGDNNDVGPIYPCSYSFANVICVAASDSADRLTGFSNYGPTSVDLAAPGQNILSAAPASATAFSTGFEEDAVPFSTGGTSFWGFELDPYGYYATDSPYELYANNTDSWIGSDPFSLTGKSGCKLNYWLYLDTELEYDGLLVEATTNGSDYVSVGGWTGWSETWVPLSQDLSGYDGLPQVGISFRLVSDAATRADGAYVDDVSVDCAATSATNDDFVYLPGTSMAAPHVAGAAALMLAANPNATVAELRSALLGGVDAQSGLSTKVASGGRLNIFNSVQLITAGAEPSPTPTTSPTPEESPSPTSSPSPSPTPVDTSAPLITDVFDRPDPFTPNGDGRRDRVRIYWTIYETAYVRVRIEKRSGRLVKRFAGSWDEAGGWYIPWNGRNRSGRLARSGIYIYKISAADVSGNRRVKRGRVTLRR